MAVGDTSDVVQRLLNALPRGWFPDSAPNLTAVLTGFAAGFSRIYGLLQFVKAQARIATAGGVWLDALAADFLGTRLLRKPGQPDSAWRVRVAKEIVRARNTRAALAQALLDLTGRAPIIFEPAYAKDTGGFGFQGMTAGTGLEFGGTSVAGAGGWGSLALPFQAFVTAYRATGIGISSVAGFYTGAGWAGGGYGTGAIEFAQLAQSVGQITDADIDAAIAAVMPVATIAWTRISN